MGQKQPNPGDNHAPSLASQTLYQTLRGEAGREASGKGSLWLYSEQTAGAVTVIRQPLPHSSRTDRSPRLKTNKWQHCRAA